MLTGKTALITGASRGLGRALSEALARTGAKLILVARQPGPLHALVAEISARGGEAHAIVADVADKSATYAIAGQAAALVGPIDILIQNASTLGPTPLPLLLDTACEDLEAVLQTNLVGPFRLAKAIVGSMTLRGSGLVVQISSDAAVEAYPGWGAYGVSKAAFDHMARIWAAELADTGVRFVSIDPGEMATEMHAAAMPEADPGTLARPEEVATRILGVIRNSQPWSNGARLCAQRLS